MSGSRLPSRPPAAPGAFASRAVVATLAIMVFAALAWADARGFAGASPGWWLLPMAVALAASGAAEAARLAHAVGGGLRPGLVQAATAALPLAAAAGAGAFSDGVPACDPVGSQGWTAAACMAGVAVLCIAEVATYRPGGGALPRLAAEVAIVVMLGLPLAFIVGLRLMRAGAGAPASGEPPTLGVLPLVSLVAVVKAGDVAAYLVGSLAGRHRMAPTLSPKKTWEGAAAALVASVAVAWLVFEGRPWGTSVRPRGGWAVFGIAVGVAAMLGDLVESLVKRELGAKDSGCSLGGLGGVLDLLDSLLLAAPVAWLLWASAV